MRSLYSLLPAILGLVGLAACMASEPEGIPPSLLSEPAGLELQLPTGTLRQTVWTSAERLLNGSQFNADLALNNIMADGDTVVFSPDYDSAAPDILDAAYAVYGWELLDYGGETTLNLDWDGEPDSGDLWMGLSSYPSARWVWVKPADVWSYDYSDNADFFGPAGQFYVVIVLLGSTECTLNSIRLGAPVDEPLSPVAALSADQLSGPPPITVQFNSNMSSDPDGMITLYEVDKDNDGIFEDSSPTPPSWSQSFTTAGQFKVTLRVTDNDGLTDTDLLRISTSVDGTWAGVVIPGVRVLPAPVWNAGGLPGVAYNHIVDTVFIHAQDNLGEGWDSPVTVGNSGSGSTMATALINGRPAVAYETVGGSNYYLHFALANDAAGSSWSGPYQVCIGPTTPGVYGDPRLCEVEGRPAIFYQNNPDGTRELFFYRAEDATGQSWGEEGVVIGPDNVVGLSDACLINGNPAIAFVWRNNAENRYEIAYARSSQSSGFNDDDWGSEVQLLAMAPGTPGDVCYGLDLIEAGGRPAVAWCSYAIPSGAKDVSFLRANDATGAGWPASAVPLYTCTGVNDYVKYPELALIDGNPAVVFQEWSPGTFGRIVYSRAVSADAAAWGAMEEAYRVDSDVDPDFGPFVRPRMSLGESGGLPAIVSRCETLTDTRCLFLTRR